ncbi:uncharacterized protein LOC121139281 isoform X2 [Mesocricetus auratus]|uniref:Uncharacterized protein LOC121139281 isoform X2 n=1 Tax=Mesocricetus auratus TaxID=10036 RepID=A0ABM2XCC1_MESAU|nr:uncharacterized protein LOC121139281 isoform X2 [Mesocricetus auratus]
MAAAPLVHPSMLTSELPGYYRDENQRLWMVVGLGISPDHPSHIMIENRANIVLLKEPELGLQSSSASGMAALNVR